MRRTTWDSWMVIIGGFVFYMFQLGTHKALGVFVPYYIDGLDMTAYQVGISCGIGAGVKFLLGPIWAAATGLANSRILTFFGGILTGCGFIWAGFSTTQVDLSLALLMTGIGLGLPLVAVQNIVRDYFADKNHTLAVGLIFVGSAVGMTLFPPIVELCVDKYGWRSASVLLGASCFNISVGAALFKPFSDCGVKPRENIHDDDSSKLSQKSCQLRNSHQYSINNLKETLGEICFTFLGLSSIVEEPFLLIYFVAFILWGIAYTGWMLFLFSYAMSIGYTPRFASLLSAVGGLGTLTGRLTTTFLFEKVDMSAQMQFVILSAGSCLALFLYPITSESWALMAVSFLAGIGIGTPPAVMVLITKDLISPENYSGALGLLFLFQGIGLFAGGPLTGLVYDMTNGFTSAFISLAMAELVAAILALVKAPEIIKLLA